MYLKLGEEYKDGLYSITAAYENIEQAEKYVQEIAEQIESKTSALTQLGFEDALKNAEQNVDDWSEIESLQKQVENYIDELVDVREVEHIPLCQCWWDTNNKNVVLTQENVNMCEVRDNHGNLRMSQADLKTALNTANPGDTVVLTGNIVLSTFLQLPNMITLDLGGYSISGNNTCAFFNLNGTKETTIQNGTLIQSMQSPFVYPVHVSAAVVYLKDIEFTNNTLEQIIHVDKGSKILISGGSVHHNSQPFIYIASGCELIMNDVEIYNNTSKDSNGLIFLGGTTKINNCLIKDNISSNSALIRSQNTTTINNSIIKNNKVAYCGGGLEIEGNLTINNTQLLYNTALIGGSIFSCTNANVIVNSGMFSDRELEFEQIPIYIDNTIYKSQITINSGTFYCRNKTSLLKSIYGKKYEYNWMNKENPNIEVMISDAVVFKYDGEDGSTGEDYLPNDPNNPNNPNGSGGISKTTKIFIKAAGTWKQV